jgi:hypothetical protein
MSKPLLQNSKFDLHSHRSTLLHATVLDDSLYLQLSIIHISVRVSHVMFYTLVLQRSIRQEEREQEQVAAPFSS